MAKSFQKNNDKRRGDDAGSKKFRKIREQNKKKGTSNYASGGKKESVSPHPNFENIFVNKSKLDAIMTKNMCPGTSVYNEKRTSVSKNGETVEYRHWNPYRSKLAAGIVCGLDNIYINKGSKVLYLGAANGTTLSHVSEIVGEDTLIYAVEFSKRTGRDLIDLALKRPNIVPIIADARNPALYSVLVPMVDTIFTDVSQFDQSRIVMENAKHFLKDNGKILISIKASCVDSSIPADEVFANEVNWLKKNEFKPIEQVTLEPYERNHALLVGSFKPGHKK